MTDKRKGVMLINFGKSTTNFELGIYVRGLFILLDAIKKILRNHHHA